MSNIRQEGQFADGRALLGMGAKDRQWNAGKGGEAQYLRVIVHSIQNSPRMDPRLHIHMVFSSTWQAAHGKHSCL
jgi:hypothetical protein